MHNIIFIILV